MDIYYCLARRHPCHLPVASRLMFLHLLNHRRTQVNIPNDLTSSLGDLVSQGSSSRGSWWGRLVLTLGITLTCVFSGIWVHRCDAVMSASRAARERPPKPPSYLRSLSVTSPGTLQKRQACEIVRAGHERWSAGGERLEDVTASRPSNWTWPSGAPLSLEGTCCLPFPQWE